MNKGFWNDNPDKLEFLIQWYPHWGVYPLAAELHLPRPTVRNKAQKLGLAMLPKELRLCFYCREGFQVPNKGIACIKCFSRRRQEKRRNRISSDPFSERLKESLRTLRRRQRQMGFDESDITLDDLRRQYEKQGGACFWTGRPMVVTNKVGRGRNLMTLSVDRIIPFRGYEKDNFVLCTLWANLSKQNLSWDDFLYFCHDVCITAQKTRWDKTLPTFVRAPGELKPVPAGTVIMAMPVKEPV